ncbi:MAG: tRNA (adenosine(37)-N6)-dimethylallyltransferase MiaA [Bacteroidota bacterium]|nr:tRNA (adenosine(37)-N6)-dimethylallyltransferase MiaA [Bacteroidota bacterium]
MSAQKEKTCIILAGPTAVGKTAVGIELARHFNTSIISADSRQCFREMNIGVARPSLQELAAVPHYFVASHSIKEEITAASFEAYALNAAATIFREHDVAVMVGGTGLYIKAFAEGMDNIPPIPASIRSEVQAGYDANGLSWLQTQLQEKDPVWFSGGEIQNPQRMMRALEVVLSTGESIRQYQQANPRPRPFRIIPIALELPRPVLYERINQRVLAMMENGLLDEVKSLLPYRSLNALQTVGYKELFDYLDGRCSLDEAVSLVQQNTRHYAKRQLTWFRKQPATTWFSPLDYSQLIKHLDKLV